MKVAEHVSPLSRPVTVGSSLPPALMGELQGSEAFSYARIIMTNGDNLSFEVLAQRR